MKECKRLIKEFDNEIKDEESRYTPEVNKQLNDEKQSMVATDKGTMLFLVLIVCGVIGIIVVKIVKSSNKDIRDIPGLAPPAPPRRLLYLSDLQ